MTPLTKAVHRITGKRVGKREVIITISPAGQDEAMIGLRLKGTRTQYVVTLSDVYRVAALWHANKVSLAKRAARKGGIPWKKAKKQFDALNRI